KLLKRVRNLTMKAILVQIFCPIKGLQYFADYIRISSAISLNTNSKWRSCIYVCNLILILKSIHYLYLGTQKLTPLERALLFDGLHLLAPKSTLNLMGFFIECMVVYYNVAM